MDLNPSRGLAVFTDGSAYVRDRSGGWAWVALDAFEGIHTASGSASDTTNNQMELQAPIEALDAIYKTLGSQEILVYSDSEYVVKGVGSWLSGWKQKGWTTTEGNPVKNRSWWEALDDAINRHTEVVFEHVKGHSDSVYNEMADELAGKARKNE